MRIISGRLKGRNITPPQGFDEHPTTDFAKTGLFNILNNTIEWENMRVLELFSGSGSMGFEFVSRGCPAVTGVELSKFNAEFIRNTAKQWDVKEYTIIRADVFQFLKLPVQTGFDLVFADPPFDNPDIDKLPDLILNNGFLNEGGLLVLEHSRKQNFVRHKYLQEEREYGKVHFSFFEKKEEIFLKKRDKNLEK